MTERFAIVLARHPAVTGVEGLCYGQRDVTLAHGWERMADGLRTVMQGVGCRVLFSSPARRCQMVAERVARFMDLDVRIDSRLREISFGEWEGRPWAHIPRTALDAWAADVSGFTPPGGGKRSRPAGAGGVFLGGYAAPRAVLRGHNPWGAATPHAGHGPWHARQPARALAPHGVGPGRGTGRWRVQHRAVRTAHSVTTAVAPRTSPVWPPICHRANAHMTIVAMAATTRQ